MTPATRPARWLKLALVVSLALNLLVAGALAGAAWRWTGGEPARHAEASGASVVVFGLGPYSRALDEAQRREFRDAARLRGGEFREGRRVLRAQLGEFIALLRADSFDAAAATELLARQRVAARDQERIGHELLVAQLAAMSPYDRRAFADRLERRRNPR